MKQLNLTSLIRIFTLTFAAFSLTGLTGCMMSSAEICTKRFPEFEQKLSAAHENLAPWNVSGRRLASAHHTIEKSEREGWLRWALERLVEAQHYMDALDGMPDQIQVRSELSEIATDIVSFHGYARQGKGEHMVRTLERIQERSVKARGLACPGNQVAARSVAGG